MHGRHQSRKAYQAARWQAIEAVFDEAESRTDMNLDKQSAVAFGTIFFQLDHALENLAREEGFDPDELGSLEVGFDQRDFNSQRSMGASGIEDCVTLGAGEPPESRPPDDTGRRPVLTGSRRMPMSRFYDAPIIMGDLTSSIIGKLTVTDDEAPYVPDVAGSAR